MTLKKRKIKYSVIFCLYWFAALVFLVDGVLKFQTLVDWFGSYALVEIMLLLLVFLGSVAKVRGLVKTKTGKTHQRTKLGWPAARNPTKILKKISKNQF